MTTEKIRAFEWTLDRSRKELNVLVRRPFYTNLRLGLTQNALWVGRGFDRPGGGDFTTIFNCFPWPWSESSTFFGHTSRATVRTMREYISNAEYKRMEAGQ